MKRKKFWITFSIVLASIFVVFLGTYFLTKLSSVSIEFRTRRAVAETRLEDGILEKVKANGEFNYNGSVLFMNTKKSVEKIEVNNPYVKVEQVIRKFPNKLHVYISERIPKYRIRETLGSENWIILDEDFKVLEKMTTAEVSSNHLDTATIEVKYFAAKAQPGTFLDKPTEKQRLNAILSGVYGKTKDYFVVVAVDYETDSQTFTLTMKSSIDSVNYQNGCEIQIIGLDNLKNKANEAVHVYTDDEGKLQATGVDLEQKVIIRISELGHCVALNP